MSENEHEPIVFRFFQAIALNVLFILAIGLLITTSVWEWIADKVQHK